MKWVRATDGAIFGVCKGMANALDLSVGLVRLLWVLSVLFFGAGLWLYLMLAISLPRADKAVEAMNPWILGVCAQISLRTNVEVGLVRFLALNLAFMSGGATLVGYIVLYFVFQEKSTPQRADTNPATPPATT